MLNFHPARRLQIEMLNSLGNGTAESCIHFVISSSISKFMLNPGTFVVPRSLCLLLIQNLGTPIYPLSPPV